LLRTLKNVADFMAGMHGRRKAVIVFSEGINYDTGDAFHYPLAFDLRRELQELIAKATRSNVNFYPVDPRGVTTGLEDAIEIGAVPADEMTSTRLLDEMRLEHDNLRVIAEETGGFAVLDQNDLSRPFSRILEDNSSYYVLGYHPANDEHDGKFRNMQVRVAGKPGLRVRTRRGYNAPVPAKKVNAVRGTSAEQTSPDLLDALESPVPVSGLTVNAFAAPLKGTGNTATIALVLEVDAATMTFAPNQAGRYANDLEVTLYALDSGTGKVTDGARDVVGVALRPQVTEMRGPFRLIRSLAVPPGRYQVRIGAKESGGKLGTLLCDLIVPDFSKGPIAMSGLVLSSAFASRISTVSPGGPDVKDRLPIAPTVQREFTRGDELSAFVEIYDNLGPAPPHRVGITTTVVSEAGKTVFVTSEERASGELPRVGGGYVHVSKVPLSTLEPGRYILRLEARPSLGNSAPIVRELEFSVANRN
jgi:hypothetical protein